MGAPTRLGRYIVRRRLGAGGFATVWLAHDEQLDAEVAIKVLADNWGHDDSVRRRFLEEGRFLRRVESEHVVQVHDVGELEDGRPFLVLTYADRGTLADRLKEQPLPLPEAVDVVVQVGRGLQALHRRGLLHRDVKPANVLFRSTDDGERAVLSDLGLGKSLDEVSRITMPGGTPSYVAPEQALGERLDQRADQYSLGAVAYAALTGRSPHQVDGLGAASRVEVAPPPSSLGFDLPEQVDATIVRALHPDRESRWPDIQTFTRQLVGALDEPTRDLPAPARDSLTVATAAEDLGAKTALSDENQPTIVGSSDPAADSNTTQSTGLGPQSATGPAAQSATGSATQSATGPAAQPPGAQSAAEAATGSAGQSAAGAVTGSAGQSTAGAVTGSDARSAGGAATARGAGEAGVGGGGAVGSDDSTTSAAAPGASGATADAAREASEAATKQLSSGAAGGSGLPGAASGSAGTAGSAGVASGAAGVGGAASGAAGVAAGAVGGAGGSRRRWGRWVVAALVVLVVGGGAGYGGHWYLAGRKQVVVSDGRFEVTMPRGWAKSKAVSDWLAPGAKNRLPSFRVSRDADWSAGSPGVFVGVSASKLAFPDSTDLGCRDSAPYTGFTQGGERTTNRLSTQCGPAAMVLFQRVVARGDGGSLLVQVIVPGSDVNRAAEIADSVKYVE
ncbi:protein kinase [Kribbella solani]|nr:protein kinase [Kribbella solani]